MAAQLALRDDAGLRRYQVTQTIGGVIAANTVLIRIHLQHILGPTRIVLQRRRLKGRASAGDTALWASGPYHRTDTASSASTPYHLKDRVSSASTPYHRTALSAKAPYLEGDCIRAPDPRQSRFCLSGLDSTASTRKPRPRRVHPQGRLRHLVTAPNRFRVDACAEKRISISV